MVESKPGRDILKYMEKNPLAENKYPPYTPKLSFESKNYFPEINFSATYTYINQPINMETVHTHDFDQFLVIIGTPEDVRDFDGEVEIYLGEEGAKNIINKTSVVYIPKGLVHGPIIWKRVDKPIMLFNVALSPEYSRKEYEAGSRVTSGASSDAAAKYEKYIIREPYHWTIFPPYTPRLFFDAKNHFPEANFGIRYTYINQGINMERPHAHDFDQFLCNLGPPEDISRFDAELELYLGEEGAKNILNTSTVSYIPAGLIHGPTLYRKINKPMMLFNVILTPQYTRSDQRAELRNYLELSEQRLTLEEASRILGVAVPQPAYLPEGCKIQEIYAQDNSLRLLISDKEIEKQQLTLGDASGTRQRYSYECIMEMSIKWYPEGKKGGLKVPGEQVTIGKGSKGVLADRENYIELWWLLPQWSTPDTPGQYEIVLSAGKKTTKDELVKVARSVE
jgi:hypothetical protein